MPIPSPTGASAATAAVAYPAALRRHAAPGPARAAVVPHAPAFDAFASETAGDDRAGARRPGGLGCGAVPEHAHRFCADVGVEMRLSRLGEPADDLDRMAQEAHAIGRLLDDNPRAMSRPDIAAPDRAAY